jgi:hypothetical protein
VLKRLAEHNVKVNQEKCSFLAENVQYLGHVLTAAGRQPIPEKVSAIRNATEPKDVSELRTFLGMVNYYGAYLPDLATILSPLNRLLRNDVPWKWTKECQKSFESVKSSLTSDRVLTHYDPSQPLILACDASPDGVGVVLSHLLGQEEHPIAFASRTLTKAEKGYSQIEKEGLGIVYGVKKFHKYLYGRKFTLVTDHKPLTKIFGPKTEVPTLAALRLQRWALILMAYNYDISYKRSAENANADYLSRKPMEVSSENLELSVNYFSHVQDLPVRCHEISACTRKDPVLAKVLQFTLEGWPAHVDDPELQPYFLRRHELSADQGCLLWGMRVVIPTKFHDRMVQELHNEHLGIVRMKALARSYFWFPGIDKSIEELSRACNICQSLRKDPPPSPLYPWKYPERPWDRIHVDFAEYDSQYFLVVIDAYSKWMEIELMKSTTAEKTVEVMRELFARYGVCRELVSDNGPQFISETFQDFIAGNGIKHTLTAPYHPASNGAAERSVQILKDILKKNALESHAGVSTKHRLCNFLLTYRMTPHTVTGVSPAELFLKRQLRSRLSLIRPDLREDVIDNQERGKAYRDNRVPKLREFVKNERVRVKSCRGSDVNFVPGVIVHRNGPVNYLVRVGRNIRYVHVDHLIKAGDYQEAEDEPVPPMVNPVTKDFPIHPPNCPVAQVPLPRNEPAQNAGALPEPDLPKSPVPGVPSSPVLVPSASPIAKKTVSLRRSSRETRLPQKLSDYVVHQK